MKTLLFDLDQTVVESSLAEDLRNSVQWGTAYKTIPAFKLYPEMLETLSWAKEKGLKICIVTSSPSTYCHKVLDYWKIPHDVTVCFHDTKKHKPDPAPLKLGLVLTAGKNEESIAFGDHEKDIAAARSAGVTSVACLWYTKDVEALIASNPDFIAEKPSDLKPLIKKFYRIE